MPSPRSLISRCWTRTNSNDPPRSLGPERFDAGLYVRLFLGFIVDAIILFAIAIVAAAAAGVALGLLYLRKR
ncbi:hypothetical protein B0G76_2878 [Paraburkholderia sp. BL23I1N1]|nr:hypothetical protein B0G76_2878 [Paraburkholderia sp. BL23I1N1]